MFEGVCESDLSLSEYVKRLEEWEKERLRRQIEHDVLEMFMNYLCLIEKYEQRKPHIEPLKFDKDKIKG